MSIRILALLPTMTDSRIARRIDMLREGGFEVEAAAFERDQGSGSAPDCPVKPLGRIRHGHYLTRIKKLLMASSSVRSLINRNDMVYAFNPDLALLGLISGVGLNRPVVLEVADIRNIQVARNWAGSAVRWLDKITIERCQLIVLTTAGYCRYYRDWLGTTKGCIVIENKLDASFVASIKDAYPPPCSEDLPPINPLRIGWFGNLRDEWTLCVLESLISSAPGRFVAIVAGIPQLDGGDYVGIRDFYRRVQDNPGIDFRGEYSYPRDLPSLYGCVDMTMLCFERRIPTNWAQSNRYYEACLFRTPLIVRAGAANSDQVRRHNIGLEVSASDAAAAAEEIKQVTADDLAIWRSHMAALPTDVYSTTDEVDRLRSVLIEIGNA